MAERRLSVTFSGHSAEVYRGSNDFSKWSDVKEQSIYMLVLNIGGTGFLFIDDRAGTGSVGNKIKLDTSIEGYGWVEKTHFKILSSTQSYTLFTLVSG